MNGEAGNDQAGDNRYSKHEAQFHTQSLRAVRASGLPDRCYFLSSTLGALRRTSIGQPMDDCAKSAGFNGSVTRP